MPASESELFALRYRLEKDLDMLLTTSQITVDNSPPLSYGFSLGTYLAFHGHNNVIIKSKLYRVYLRFCPSLNTGIFLTKDVINITPRPAVEMKYVEEDIYIESKPTSTLDVEEDDVDVEEDRKDVLTRDVNDVEDDHGTVTDLKNNGGTKNHDTSSRLDPKDVAGSKDSLYPPEETQTLNPCTNDASGENSTIVTESVIQSCPANTTSTMNSNGSIIDSSNYSLGYNSNKKPIRIGFISKFFSACSVGFFIQGLIQVLSATPGIEVHVFVLDGIKLNRNGDKVLQSIKKVAHETYLLTDEMNICISAVRNAALDVIVYPEIGLDPISYFMAYVRLAPVQAVMLGHPDTTGISTIDYFITSDVEVQGAEKSYTEKLYRMRGPGTVFADYFVPMTVPPTSTQSKLVVAERIRFLETFGLPKATHLYVVPQPLFKLHGKFDEVLLRILLQDRLSYILLFDSANKTSWQNLFTDRVLGKYNNDVRGRIAFLCSNKESDITRALYVAHVVLDSFPVSGHLSTMQSLSMGVPVITMPSEIMGGRLALALYQMIGYMELVVHSVSDYVTLALAIAHRPKLRTQHVVEITKRRHRLFDSKHVVEDWLEFFRTNVQPAVDVKSSGTVQSLDTENDSLDL